MVEGSKNIAAHSKWILISTTLILIQFFGTGTQLLAQCATCKAAAATQDESGDLIIGAGLNTGILYLLAMPFLISAIIGIIWYRNRKKLREVSS